jgi:hypothetical protein
MNYKIYLLKRKDYTTPTKYIYFVGSRVPVEIQCSSSDHNVIHDYVREACDRLCLDMNNIVEVNDRKF